MNWGYFRDKEFMVRSMRSPNISWQWHNFKSQILPQEKILAVLLLTWLLKKMCLGDLLGLREQWACVCLWWSPLLEAGFLLVYHPLVLLVPVLPVLVREMEISFLPSAKTAEQRAFDGVSLFERSSDFKMRPFHLNSYCGWTMKTNLHVLYIAMKNYYYFDNVKCDSWF